MAYSDYSHIVFDFEGKRIEPQETPAFDSGLTVRAYKNFLFLEHPKIKLDSGFNPPIISRLWSGSQHILGVEVIAHRYKGNRMVWVASESYTESELKDGKPTDVYKTRVLCGVGVYGHLSEVKLVLADKGIRFDGRIEYTRCSSSTPKGNWIKSIEWRKKWMPKKSRNYKVNYKKDYDTWVGVLPYDLRQLKKLLKEELYKGSEHWKKIEANLPNPLPKEDLENKWNDPDGTGLFNMMFGKGKSRKKTLEVEKFL